MDETFKEDIRSLLLQLGDVELGDGESLFRVHDVLPSVSKTVVKWLEHNHLIPLV